MLGNRMSGYGVLRVNFISMSKRDIEAIENDRLVVDLGFLI